MLLPLRTNILPRRTPYANYLLIIANVVIFLLTYGPHQGIWEGRVVVVPVEHVVERFMLIPAERHWWQFLSYAFLHGGLMHIVGNMFFLYLFGNNVNDKLGHVGYLGFYLAGAVFSGIGHTLVNYTSYVPTLGASGAIAAVTGAYLVLFPQTLVTVLYWFFILGTVEVPALYFIGFKMIVLDNVIIRYTPGVAYDAHLAGYAFGIAAGIVLLATSVVPSSSFDLWAMVKRWNRRRQYRDVVWGGFDPFTRQAERKPVDAKEVKKTAAELEKESQAKELRTQINSRIAEHNLAAAADLYLELMQLDRGQVLPRQHLLDIANQLASDNRPTQAALAYEQFLKHYGNYEYAEQVELMLGILYSRYLHQPKEAMRYLQAAADKLSDPNQLKMCTDELARLQD
jgi:membrane associated rhomboid family serine protease